MTGEQLEAEALLLPAQDRARLAEALIHSLDEDSEHERAWAAEVERRWRDLQSGAVQAIPAEDVIRDADELLCQ